MKVEKADHWLERFKEEALPLIQEQWKPHSVIFFGSRVIGNATEESDIDLIVISDSFEDTPFVNRAAPILKMVRFQKHIDLFCYTPEEFETVKKNSAFVQKTLEHAMILNGMEGVMRK